MQRTFTSAGKAAEYAATKAEKWMSWTKEAVERDELIALCRTHDEESPVSSSDDDEFYIVTDAGEIGYTCDGGDGVDWLFTVEGAPREPAREASGQEDPSAGKEFRPEYGGSVGFSPLINDPEIQKAKMKARKYSVIGGVIVPILVILVFAIVSIFSDEVDLASVAVFGGGIALVIVVINLCQFRRRRKPDWEGVVTGKHIESRTERRTESNGNEYHEKVPVFVVEFLTTDGKKKSCSVSMDSGKGHADWYTYLNVGDKVHYHAAFDTYEKYDTTKELQLPCVVCGRLNRITNTHCEGCKKPLLK